MKPLLHAWISFAQSNVCTTCRDNIWFIFQLHSLSLISQFIHSFSIEYATSALFMFQHYKCNQIQHPVWVCQACCSMPCSINGFSVENGFYDVIFIESGNRSQKVVYCTLRTDNITATAQTFSEYEQFSIIENLTEHNGQSISTSHNNDLTIACFYFSIADAILRVLAVTVQLNQLPLYNTVFPSGSFWGQTASSIPLQHSMFLLLRLWRLGALLTAGILCLFLFYYFADKSCIDESWLAR